MTSIHSVTDPDLTRAKKVPARKLSAVSTVSSHTQRTEREEQGGRETRDDDGRQFAQHEEKNDGRSVLFPSIPLLRRRGSALVNRRWHRHQLHSDGRIHSPPLELASPTYLGPATVVVNRESRRRGGGGGRCHILSPSAEMNDEIRRAVMRHRRHHRQSASSGIGIGGRGGGGR
jgi:hypothetical protein